MSPGATVLTSSRAGPTPGRAAPPPAWRVLVVESRAGVGEVLVEQLTADGYHAELAHSREHARTLALRTQPGAIVVGDLDTRWGALELVREIRAERPSRAAVWSPELPIIMHGACAGELDMLRAFDAGVDDLVRPLRYLELRARLRALLRRSQLASHAGLPAEIAVGPLRIDVVGRGARLYGRPLDPRRLELELLVHLARDPERVFTKQELLAAVWGYRSHGATRTVDSHASRLRRRLEDIERLERQRGRWVINVWGVGYRLR